MIPHLCWCRHGPAWGRCSWRWMIWWHPTGWAPHGAGTQTSGQPPSGLGAVHLSALLSPTRHESGCGNHCWLNQPWALRNAHTHTWKKLFFYWWRAYFCITLANMMALADTYFASLPGLSYDVSYHRSCANWQLDSESYTLHQCHWSCNWQLDSESYTLHQCHWSCNWQLDSESYTLHQCHWSCNWQLDSESYTLHQCHWSCSLWHSLGMALNTDFVFF